jgi:uncharacterized repeat protein (TIGR01451 family)
MGSSTRPGNGGGFIVSYAQKYTSALGCRSLFSPFAFVLALAACALAFGVAATTARAQTPADPQVVFQEDFENGQTGTLLGVDARDGHLGYTGSQGQTYTADAHYLDWSRCNGWIPALAQGASAWDTAGVNCQGGIPDPFIPISMELSRLIGEHAGSADAGANHAVVENTGVQSTGNAGVMLEATGIKLPGSGRFVTFSADVAEYCANANAQDTFALLDGANPPVPLRSQPYSVCEDPSVPGVQASGKPARAGTFTGDRSFLLSSDTIGFRISNVQDSGDGNDQAFDNFRILDVTPTLTKAFAPAETIVGAPGTLTFTVTNTSELAAKNGFGFTDRLPSGVAVADRPETATTCPGGTITASPGGGTIGATGNLDAGQASCTFTVAVAAVSAGTFSNCAENVTTTGLNPPGCATIRSRVRLALTKTGPARARVLTPVRYRITVRNPSSSRVVNVLLRDRIPRGLSFVRASAGRLRDGQVAVRLGTLRPGQAKTVHVWLRAAADTTGRRVNCAVATGPDVTEVRDCAATVFRSPPRREPPPVTG